MKNSKMFPILAVVISIALVSYIAVFKIDWNKDGGMTASSGSSPKNREILSYIPANTIFFYGGLEPASLKEFADIMSPQSNWMSKLEWSAVQKDASRENLTPAQKMVTGLYFSYMEALQDIEKASQTFGTGDKLDSAFYTVGAIPALRIKLADPAAFNSFIDNVEQKSNTTSEKGNIDSINFRSYDFDRKDGNSQAGKKSGVKLIIAESDGYALFTLSTPLEDSQARKKIMGSEKPVESLASVPLLADIKNKHGFHPAYIGYLNHREVMDGLTSTGSNDFGRMLDVLFKAAAESQAKVNPDAPSMANASDPLAKIRTPECRSELMAVADNWPHTLFGYTQFDAKSQPKRFVAKGLIESHDKAFMNEFVKIRGYIPSTVANVDSKPIIGIGLGLNVDALVPFMTAVIQGITQKNYQCQMLADMKQSLAASNPAMALGMMSGMVAGLQGISAAILDLDGPLTMNEQQPIPDIKSIDAIITVSSANPQSILMMAANFMQGMPPIQLPPDGTPIDLPIPFPLPLKDTPKLALKGNHLVAYIGPKGEQAANKLATETLETNGLFTLAMDFGRYMKFIAEGMEGVQKTSTSESTEKKTAEAEMLKALNNVKGQLVESMDVSDEGIEFGLQMTME